MKIVVGLGNPEHKYANTRHNLGFKFLDEFQKKMNLSSWSMEDKFKAEIIRTSILQNPDSSLRSELKTDQLILVKPQTYMNQSGLAVSKIANFFKVSPEDIIVIHDELDLPLGKIKVRIGGAAAGNHGVESVINNLGTDKFIRIRLGIGNERTFSGEHKRISFSAERFVLEEFMPGEKSKVKHMIKQAIKALEIILDQGIEKAQNQFN